MLAAILNVVLQYLKRPLKFSSFLITTLQLLNAKNNNKTTTHTHGERLQPLFLKINIAPRVGGAYVHAQILPHAEHLTV